MLEVAEAADLTLAGGKNGEEMFEGEMVVSRVESGSEAGHSRQSGESDFIAGQAAPMAGGGGKAGVRRRGGSDPTSSCPKELLDRS